MVQPIKFDVDSLPPGALMKQWNIFFSATHVTVLIIGAVKSHSCILLHSLLLPPPPPPPLLLLLPESVDSSESPLFSPPAPGRRPWRRHFRHTFLWRKQNNCKNRITKMMFENITRFVSSFPLRRWRGWPWRRRACTPWRAPKSGSKENRNSSNFFVGEKIHFSFLREIWWCPPALLRRRPPGTLPRSWKPAPPVSGVSLASCGT